ncbi:hypothetical protein V1511DRAFT_286770 [Dipodascopsis uninucleata]
MQPFSLEDLPYYTESHPVALVTGGTSGIGKIAVRELYNHGVSVYFTARNIEKASKTIDEIKNSVPKPDQVSDHIHILHCDFMDLKTVVKAVEDFKSREPKLDILINNAGSMYAPYKESEDGFETTLQVDYIAPYLLTRLLMESLDASPSPRVINVTSIVHYLCPGFNFSNPNLLMSPEFVIGGFRYAQAKLAIIMFTKEIARQHPNVISMAVHPGVIPGTSFYQHLLESDEFFGLVKYIARVLDMTLSPFFGVSIEEGSFTNLFCALSDKITHSDSGGYFGPIARHATCSAQANNVKNAKKLWDWTEAALRSKSYSIS